MVPADLGVPVELEAAERLGYIARQCPRRPQLLSHVVDRSKRHGARIVRMAQCFVGPPRGTRLVKRTQSD